MLDIVQFFMYLDLNFTVYYPNYSKILVMIIKSIFTLYIPAILAVYLPTVSHASQSLQACHTCSQSLFYHDIDSLYVFLFPLWSRIPGTHMPRAYTLTATTANQM